MRTLDTARLLAACVTTLLLARAGAATAGDIDPTAVQLWDVIYTADGSVLKGVIIEEVPGTSYRISLAGGSSLVVQASNVTKLGKELNPGFAATVVRGDVGATSPRAHPRTTSGLRIGLMPGIAAHVDSDTSTFLASARAGWELVLEDWGLTPSGVVDFVTDAASYGGDAVTILPSVRAAYRASSVSPFVGFGIGLDIVGSDTSLGTQMGAGVDLVVHPRVALTAEVKYHRGWGNTYTQTMEYVGLGMGVEIRL